MPEALLYPWRYACITQKNPRATVEKYWTHGISPAWTHEMPKIIFYSEKKLEQQYEYVMIRLLDSRLANDVTMKTTVGDIELELWAKETPKTCRNFIQLCVEGGFIHKVVIPQVQEKVNEFHTRLRFCRRDLIAMANAEKDDNGS
ncbi:Peptidyl-prolyl cis-trans isomerase CWC27 like protein [Eufriesea mexicana]|uniref:Spliceosome-associated protein CWC27 homolog n=1 Tax=Eufriesea mexicana TaxID=516756 RepID=A0A310S4U3_9HYME|nr:Peptidyl-prolyl cis-trans isomerase CWC27 like protein [Eufriesea mexicana]